MAEHDSTQSASSDDPGTGAEGGSDSGTQAGAGRGDASVAEMGRLQEQIRNLQSAKDREAAARASLEERLAAMSPDDAGESTGSVDPAAIAREAAQAAVRSITLTTTAEKLRGEFEHADESIFEGAAEFDSPEALREAARASHERVAKLVEAGTAAKEQAIREEFAKRYGITIAPTADSQPDDAAEPSPQQLARMSMAELDAVEEKFPGLIDRVLRS